MRPILLLIPAVALAIIMLANCQSGSPEEARQNSSALKPAPVAEATPEDGVRRVTVEELRAALAEERAVAVDIRGPVEYDAAHIKGALLVPLGQIAARSNELPRGKLIVTYCA